jgi:hypothetical protein
MSDGDEDDINSCWTSFSGVSSDSDGHESAFWSEEEGSRTRRTASEPLASRNRKAAEKRRLNDLARRLDKSYPGVRTRRPYEAAEYTEGGVDPEFTEGVVSPINPQSPIPDLSDGLDNQGGVSPGVSATPRNGPGASTQNPIKWRIITEDATMPYAYPKYSNHLDAAAHVKQFQSIWAVNHGTQGLSLAEKEQSMIVDIQLCLEGHVARWYAQQDNGTFSTFQDLVDKFLELFQVKVETIEVLREYYSLQQQPGESVAEFLLRFRALQGMMIDAPTEDMQKR